MSSCHCLTCIITEQGKLEALAVLSWSGGFIAACLLRPSTFGRFWQLYAVCVCVCVCVCVLS